jgi:hypothetical protein
LLVVASWQNKLKRNFGISDGVWLDWAEIFAPQLRTPWAGTLTYFVCRKPTLSILESVFAPSIRVRVGFASGNISRAIRTLETTNTSLGKGAIFPPCTHTSHTSPPAHTCILSEYSPHFISLALYGYLKPTADCASLCRSSYN